MERCIAVMVVIKAEWPIARQEVQAGFRGEKGKGRRI